MGVGQLRVGTSGYSYPEWKPAFYPADLPATQFLDYYAARLDTVEINNTFYRFPGAELFTGWRDQTPARFSFAVKANQRITHKSRLKDVAEITQDFVARCRALEGKLAAILFQLPPNLKHDDARLAAFVTALPVGTRYAMEFRHASWFDDAVYERLRASNIALCLSEDDDFSPPREVTADFCYLRLRKVVYAPEELAAWHTWCVAQTQQGRDVLAYLKHDEGGASPEAALRVLRG